MNLHSLNFSSVFVFSINVLITISCAGAHHESQNSSCKPGSKTPSKLLILLLDGFRWDYYNFHKDQLPGFQKFLQDGLQVEYVEPIFPSISLPSWTTISTGIYPAYHNILGNVMFQRSDDHLPEMTFYFKDNSSMEETWWQSAEPIWTTETKQGNKVFMVNFARCDVPYQGILPTECTGYNDAHDVNFNLSLHLNQAIDRFQQGYTLSMIYDARVDIICHKYGPNSENLLTSLKNVDVALQEFLQNLELHGLNEKVNVVIVSDHGGTNIKNAIKLKLEDYITKPDDIYKVIGCGSMMLIATENGKTDSVFDQLSQIPGVNVYKKDDIPNSFHFKESKFVHDILILAKPNYLIVGLTGEKQVPNNCDPETWTKKRSLGSHGYHDMPDMRAIYFARGPDFKKGVVHPPIRLEDEYQTFAYVLGLESCRDNGTWENVADMFSN